MGSGKCGHGWDPAQGANRKAHGVARNGWSAAKRVRWRILTETQRKPPAQYIMLEPRGPAGTAGTLGILGTLGTLGTVGTSGTQEIAGPVRGEINVWSKSHNPQGKFEWEKDKNGTQKKNSIIGCARETWMEERLRERAGGEVRWIEVAATCS